MSFVMYSNLYDPGHSTLNCEGVMCVLCDVFACCVCVWGVLCVVYVCVSGLLWCGV